MKTLKVGGWQDPYDSLTVVLIYDGDQIVWRSRYCYGDEYNTKWTVDSLRKEVQTACNDYGMTANLAGEISTWTGIGPGNPGGMRYACVGHDVWVGEYRACDEHLHEFTYAIHIWKHNDWATGRFCRRLHASTTEQYATGGGRGLALEWLEGGRVSEMSIPIDEVAAYARQGGKMLVHCAGGICRSLTTAVICKVARGCDVFDAIKDVYKGIWPIYHNPPDFRTKTMEDIINWSFGMPCKPN